MNFRYILFFIFSALLFTGCASTSNYYSDQPPLVLKHNINADAAQHKNEKIVLLIPDHSAKNIKTGLLSQQLEAAIISGNKLNLTVIGQKQHEKMAASKGAAGKLNRIKSKYFNGITDEEITEYGKKIKADIIMIPVVTIHEYEDTPVSVEYAAASRKGDYYWPALNLTEMQIKSEAEISLHMIYISKEIPSETIRITHTLTENYDTLETFSEKQRNIREENIRRTKENLSRKKEEEYKRVERDRERREQERRAKTKADKGFLVLGEILDLANDIAGDDWCMLKPVENTIQFKKAVYHDRKLLTKDIVYQSGVKAFESYNTRFDGSTLNGDCVNGTGEFKFLNGDVCIGQWMNAEATGLCEYRYADGSSFSGNFTNGFAEGKGTFKKNNGNIYDGSYKKGKKDGSGKFTINYPENIHYDVDGYIRTNNIYNVKRLKKFETGTTYKVYCSDGFYKWVLGKEK